MDKSEFLTEILNLYGRFLDEDTKKIWIKSCHEVLDNNINYNDFWWYFCREFDTKTINNIPACQWLYQHSQQFKKKTFTPIQELPPGVPCPPEIREKMKALFGKDNPLSFDKL